MLRDALVLITVGTGIALSCVAALGRRVESLLFGVKPADLLANRRRDPAADLGGTWRGPDPGLQRVHGEPHRGTAI